MKVVHYCCIFRRPQDLEAELSHTFCRWLSSPRHHYSCAGGFYLTTKLAASRGAPQTHRCKGVCVQLVWGWTVLTLVILHQSRLRSTHVFDCTWWRAGWDPRASGWLHVGSHRNIFRWQSWVQKSAAVSALGLRVVTLCVCTHLLCKDTCLNQFWFPVLQLSKPSYQLLP